MLYVIIQEILKQVIYLHLNTKNKENFSFNVTTDVYMEKYETHGSFT